MSARKPAAAAAADGERTVLMEGWGVKEGGRVKTWKRRYIVLLRGHTKADAARADDQHTHVLVYYESRERRVAGAAPKGAVLLTRGRTRVEEVTRRVDGKTGPCLLVSTPGQREFFFAPEDARRAEWVDWLRLTHIDAAEWPQLAAVLKRSPSTRAPRRQRRPAAAAEGADGNAAARPPPPLASALLASSWPPEEGAPTSLEATMLAVAGEAAALRRTRPDDPSVNRAVEAAVRAEVSVGATASGVGSDEAEAGRDVAAAVLTLHGVDWEGRVKTAISKIDAQGAEFEEQLRHLREHEVLPAEVREVALEQLLDAVGALAATAQVLAQQAESEAKRLGCTHSSTIFRLRPELRKLPRAVAMLERWNLEVPRRLLEVDVSELQTMPLAATDPIAVDGARGSATVQRVIGALAVAGGAAALKHVSWVDFDEHGEPVFEKGKHDLDTIFRPARDVLDAPECASLATALRVYGERATAATATLVPKVFDDVAAYADARAEAMSHPDAKAALSELNALCKQVPQPCEQPEVDPKAAFSGLKGAMELVKRFDADAPPATALEHAVHKQLRAAAGSKRLYRLVSEMARGVEGHELVVLPGGVKKLARTVFKSAVNYGCDLSRITDQVRCTVVASTLAGVAAALRGLMRCGTVSVVRVKNRFASGYDATPAGGYLDLQTMVVFQSEGGGWAMGEVQINLWSMLRIKENPEGGHKIFNFARAMRAYDEATFTHDGGFDDGVAARIAAGVLLVLNLKEKAFRHSTSQVAALCKALSAGECRVRRLDLDSNEIGDSGAAVLADGLKHNNSISFLSLSGSRIGDSGAAALADALRCTTSISRLTLYGNEIGNSGASALADALKRNTSVSTLDLSWNRIGDSGAAALAEALKLNTAVATIFLEKNEIGDAGKAALADPARSGRVEMFARFIR